MQPSPLTAAVSGSVVLLAFVCAPTARAGNDCPHVVGDDPAALVARFIERQATARTILVQREPGAPRARP